MVLQESNCRSINRRYSRNRGREKRCCNLSRCDLRFERACVRVYNAELALVLDGTGPALAAFAAEVFALVAPGTEHEHLDWDQLLEGR